MASTTRAAKSTRSKSMKNNSSVEAPPTGYAVGVVQAERSRSQTERDNLFYLFMSIACAGVVFLGFSRTLYLKGYFGTPALPAFFVFHGVVMTIWMVYFILQTALIASNRAAVHRSMGVAGAVLAMLMCVLGTAMAFVADKMRHNAFPFAADPESACLFSLMDIFIFGAFVWTGFHFRRKREVHQRLMLLATVIALMPSGIGRWLSHVNPVLILPTIFAFVLAGPIYDLLSRRTVHPAYRWGLLCFVLTLPPFRILLARIEAWHSFVKWVVSSG